MNFPVPRIVRSTLAQATAAGCDCAMFRHDGWPVLINCVGEGVTIFSALAITGPLRPPTPIGYSELVAQEILDKATMLEPVTGLFVGARERGNPRIHIYDLWWFDGNDIQEFSYRERYKLARMNIRKLDDRFSMVTAHPIAAAKTLWSEVGRDPDRLKGLVFRRSKDTAAGELYVTGYYKEEPGELV